MKRILCTLLIVSILCFGCAGSDPNPIAMYQPGDENKSCSALKAEIANIDKQVSAKEGFRFAKGSGNIVLAVLGFIAIVPWLFMDLKNAEQIEIDALQQRKDALLVIAAEKNCGF